MAARPSLWPTAARQARRLARPQWWRRPPFLPLPDRDYLRFRFETQYGTGQSGTGQGSRADPRDLVTYLEWCREMPEPRRLSRTPR
ncbi:MAG: hypothetical protein WD271_10275 [Acidimicrobiia bacterium]